jgi:glutamate:GABA antiporter
MIPPGNSAPPPLVGTETDVRRHSAELKKELSLTDLVLTQVLYIAGLGWLGAAAKLGSSHFLYWLPAALFFYIPSAIVVIHLSREMPLEGGLYQWAKLRCGEMLGFLVAWNLWFYSVMLISELGVISANNLAYAVGPQGAWLAENKAVILAFSVFFAAGPMLVAVRGLGLGKWFHNVGGATLVLLLAAMLLFAVPHWIRGDVATTPLALSVPAVSLLNLNILGKMSFGAFSGCEGIAVFSGECRDPNAARVISRSVWIATPVVTAIFTLGTACILVFCAPAQLDLVSPVAQNLSLGARALGIAGPIVPLAMVLMMFARIGTGTLIFNMVSRLPMVAGWDHLLPAWFTRLHPKYRTPVGSILFVAVMILMFAVAANVGAGSQEAYQLLNNGSGICYALTYLVMFSIPLVAKGERASRLVRAAAVSGFLMTLLYVVLSVFPIIYVANGALFTLKIGSVVVGSNVLGALLFWRARARRQAPLPALSPVAE